MCDDEPSVNRREALKSLGGLGVSQSTSWGTLERGPLTPNAPIRWTFTTDGDSRALVSEIANDTVYVEDRIDNLYALDSVTGSERWRFSDSGNRPQLIEIAEDSVYVESGDTVYAVDRTNGKVHWELSPADGLTIEGDSIYVVKNDELHSMNRGSLSENWVFDSTAEQLSEVVIEDDTVYVGSDSGTVSAVSITDGNERWSFTTDGDSLLRPITARHNGSIRQASDSRVFVWDSTEGRLHACSAVDGTEEWNVAVRGDTSVFPGTFTDETVFLNRGKTTYAITISGGTLQWQYRFDSEPAWFPQVKSNTVYVGTYRNASSLHASSGNKQWEFSTKPDSTTRIVGTLEDTIVIDSWGKALYALDTGTGTLRWNFEYTEKPTWFPQIADSRIYWGTQLGTVYALTTPDSTPLYDAYRTATSPTGLAVGGLLGSALAVGAYRRRNRGALDRREPTTFEDYELLDRLAETDRAELYLARKSEGSRCGLLRFDGHEPTAFAAGLEMWADLDISGVLAVREWGTEPEPWVATAPANANLADRAIRSTSREIARVVADAAETAHRAHREGVTHGRLAPESIWLADNDVRVSDWGLAREWSVPQWLAPPEADPEPTTTDTYQLAALAFRLIANAQNNENVKRVLVRALADDPTDRYDSALKFADALRWAVRER